MSKALEQMSEYKVSFGFDLFKILVKNVFLFFFCLGWELIEVFSG